MATLVENFIRRVEKLISGRATVPFSGTNHVDDDWLSTDIYPGELTINLAKGSFYTSDGESIIDLNKENLILDGLVVQKDTSGVNKLTITSGEARINGRTYIHSSSGTDLYLPVNLGLDPILYFIYGIPTAGIYGTGASGNYALGITVTSIAGSPNEPGGVFSDVAFTSGVPSAPSDGLLLGTVLLYPGSTGFDLWPRSVALLGDYYPKFSSTPSEFLRLKTRQVWPYEYHQLFFPGEFLIDETSNTIYLVKKTFVSDYISISSDISLGNIVPLGGGGSGGTGSYFATSLGAGANVYKTTVGTQFQFRSLTASGLITLTENSDTITVGLTTSELITSLTNVGVGATLYVGLTGISVAQLRSLTAGSNVQLNTVGDNIVIDVPYVGATVLGINLGTGASADVYAGMSGNDLTFRRLSFGAGMSASQSSNTITIESTGRNNRGVNVGSGPGFIYGGMSGDNLIFRSLTGGANVSVTLSGNNIIISASGSSGSSSGINTGSTGATVGQPFIGMSGSNLLFRSITTGYGLSITNVGNNIQFDTTITDGAQGPQGPEGAQGAQGFQGVQGFQGSIGPSGADGANGPQGFQGPGNLPGATGAIGPQGPAGLNAPAGNQRFIDLYDNHGGLTAPTSAIKIVNFTISPERSNTDPSIFVSGTVSQIGPDGTYIQLNESGNYLFVYTVSVLIPSGGYAIAYLYDYTNSQKIDGSDIWLMASGGAETVTSTGKVALTNIIPGTKYVIKLESLNGTISTVADASSFFIMKMEIGLGMTGDQGPQGYNGPQGPQGIPGTGGSGVFYYQPDCPIFNDPSDIPAGSFWYNSETGVLYVRIYDNNSSQYLWVTPSQDCCLPSFFYRETCPDILPGEILPGSMWYNSENGRLLVYIYDKDTDQYLWVSPTTSCCGGTGGNGPQGAQGPQGPDGRITRFTYEIGEYVASEGGVIAHRWLSGSSLGSPGGGIIQNYLVVDIADLTTAQWATLQVDIASAESTWNGSSNTSSMIAAGASSGITSSTAADLCVNNISGGKNDWYLPSIDELSKIMQNRWDISQGLFAGTGLDLAFDDYWSSTESSSTESWAYNFKYGRPFIDSKLNVKIVRSVRKFSI